jgi:hypothetical protein
MATPAKTAATVEYFIMNVGGDFKDVERERVRETLRLPTSGINCQPRKAIPKIDGFVGGSIFWWQEEVYSQAPALNAPSRGSSAAATQDTGVECVAVATSRKECVDLVTRK